ncbi:MAG: lipopolysaccharide heptosyltransferase I [Acidobacteria bacterium]|nr:lipopolysaccharide heptosyltransferase I [Acidobacteriota bacterium]
MRFLIVRLGALGDIVHAVPVASALRRAWPDAEIDWLVSAKHREILDLVPAVTNLIVVNDRREGSGGLSLLGAVRAMRGRRYDVALDLQGLLKSAVLARLSGARRVIGFSSQYAREPLASRFYTETYAPGGAGLRQSGPIQHVVRANLGMVERLGMSAGEPEFGLRIVRSPAVERTLAGIGRRYALLNVGAAWPNKRWPASRFAALARALHERHGLPSLVLWGPAERELADEVVGKAGGAATAAPQTTIADIAAFAFGAAVMVSGDTGPTHIASAVGTPLVGIYGPTRPERNGPLGRDDESVSRAAVCQCHHLRQCKLQRMCLLDIEVPEVLAAVERRLAATERHRG